MVTYTFTQQHVDTIDSAITPERVWSPKLAYTPYFGMKEIITTAARVHAHDRLTGAPYTPGEYNQADAQQIIEDAYDAGKPTALEGFNDPEEIYRDLAENNRDEVPLPLTEIINDHCDGGQITMQELNELYWEKYLPEAIFDALESAFRRGLETVIGTVAPQGPHSVTVQLTDGVIVPEVTACIDMDTDAAAEEVEDEGAYEAFSLGLLEREPGRWQDAMRGCYGDSESWGNGDFAAVAEMDAADGFSAWALQGQWLAYVAARHGAEVEDVEAFIGAAA